MQGVIGAFYIINPGFADYYRQLISGAYGRNDSLKIQKGFSCLFVFQVFIILLIGSVGALLPVLMGMSLFLETAS